ncbi:MAG: gliding motility lipoprotein GldH [Bacteroidales bacterium]|nr:gliding motility lipoprotein GldH [Bacteroidales bacterium]
MRKTISKTLLALLLFAVLFASCNSEVMYDSSSSIAKSQWNMNEAKMFTVKVSDKDIKRNYRFAINIRNTTDYKYNNIYFFITTVYPDRSITKRDTVECILAYPDGTWKGKGNSDIKDNRFWFAKNVKFPQVGEYVFKIEQATKDTVLLGVKDIGLHIEKQPVE